MRVYLDICCLKRPFDDQSQPRVRLESEAVLALLALESDQLTFVRSPALVLENSQNPIKERAERVAEWLLAAPIGPPATNDLHDRTAALIALGFRNFDALHLASAELAGADVLATTDDRFLATARRAASDLKVRVLRVLDLAQEILK